MDREQKKKSWYQSLQPWERSYHSAYARCNYKSDSNYLKYGGKGIRLLMTKDEFKVLWERDNGERMKRPTIDRLDSKKDYVFSNCRFVEQKVNSATAKHRSWNKGTSMIEYRMNVTKTLPRGYKRRWPEHKDYIANKAKIAEFKEGSCQS